MSLPKVTVSVPGKAAVQTKLAAAEMPQVHVLTNMALVEKGTRLVALDDTVVSKAREAEKKALVAEREQEQKALAAKRTLDETKTKAACDASLATRRQRQPTE